MVSAQWLTLVVLLAVFGVFCNGQSDRCTRESFPSTASITAFLNMSQGSSAHKQYVSKFFQEMTRLEGSCSADVNRKRSLLSGISQPMFADGVAGRIWQRYGQLSFNNARTLINLLANSPPTAAADAAKSSYCYGSDAQGSCTDCNTWYNNLFLESLLRSTLESQDGLTASGVCLRSSASHMTCREASFQGSSGIVTDERSVRISSCDDSWLWQKPLENVQGRNFSNIFNVTIVPSDFYNPIYRLAPYYTTTAGINIPDLPTSASSWSTLHSQCYPNGTTQWVLIHTTPVIAVCTARLISASLCLSADTGNVVQVGSSWVAASVSEVYNITQCPASGMQESVFVGSAKCSSVTVPATADAPASSLMCIDVPQRFTPNSYVCRCPLGSYLDSSAMGNISRLASSVRAYTGAFIASEVGVNDTQLEYLTCRTCQPGCRDCTDSSPCLRENNIALRTPLLVINLIIIVAVILVGMFVLRHKADPVILSGAPFYLFIIIVSAVIASLESVILFPRLNNAVCALQPWPRHIGFVLLFSSAFGKIWRVQILARMPPGRIQISTLDRIMHRIIFILTAFVGLYLILWTAINRSTVEIVYDEEGQSYERCSTDYWRFVIHGLEIFFLVCGCFAAQLTRKLVLEWPEFKYILVAFANAAVIKGLIAVFYFTLMPNKYPDYIYLLQFFDNLFTITSAVLIIFGHKVYMIRRNKGDRVIGPTVPAKMNRKESNAELGNEISLQQLSEARQGTASDLHKRQESLDVGLFDVLFACCCGPLTKDWYDDFYGRGRAVPNRSGSQMQGTESDMTNGSGGGASDPTSAPEDSGLPYMGENN